MKYLYTMKSEFSDSYQDVFTAENDLSASAFCWKICQNRNTSIQDLNLRSNHLYRIGIFADASGDIQSTDLSEIPFLEMIEPYLKRGDENGTSQPPRKK